MIAWGSRVIRLLSPARSRSGSTTFSIGSAWEGWRRSSSPSRSGREGFQRTLVIKRMLPHLSQDRAFVKMFIDEAKLCGLLSHPNLVQIFEFGQIDESFFIAMEHVQGETLLGRAGASWPSGGASRRSRASLEIMRQVCLGLNYAHGLQSATGQPLGIVHRDVSPSNLMLSFHGGVKILDFGIARVAEELRETQDPGRHDEGQGLVHVPGAGPDGARRQPLGHLRRRHRAARDVDRPPAVQVHQRVHRRASMVLEMPWCRSPPR